MEVFIGIFSARLPRVNDAGCWWLLVNFTGSISTAQLLCAVIEIMLVVETLLYFSVFIVLFWGSEFSSYKIESRNRVTQNYVTLQVIRNSFFESLTRLRKTSILFRVTNSEMKNKKLKFELQTQNQKLKSFTSSYQLEVEN